MAKDFGKPSDPDAERPVEHTTIIERRGGGGAMIFAIVLIALVLAIGFFLMTTDRRDEARTEAVTQAAGSVDEAARAVGNAAKEAAGQLRNSTDN